MPAPAAAPPRPRRLPRLRFALNLLAGGAAPPNPQRSPDDTPLVALFERPCEAPR